MYHYTVIQWLFFFYFYCFFGWVFESTYVSLRKKQFVNRGFMRGPFLPIYGSGGIMMLVVSMPFQDNILLTYIAGCIGATALEFVTGMTMEALFKVRYWDYSDQKLNYKGHICLSSTLVWGLLTIFMTGFLHRGVENMVFKLPETLITIITVVISCVMIVDMTLSVKAAMDLRDLLISLEKAKQEMERIQKRLDVIVAVASDEIESRRMERSMKIDELMEDIEERFNSFKERMRLEPASFVEEIREEIQELKTRYLVEKEQHHYFKKVRSLYQRSLLKGNPSMRSVKFEEALEELKKAVEDKLNRKWRQK